MGQVVSLDPQPEQNSIFSLFPRLNVLVPPVAYMGRQLQAEHTLGSHLSAWTPSPPFIEYVPFGCLICQMDLKHSCLTELCISSAYQSAWYIAFSSVSF